MESFFTPKSVAIVGATDKPGIGRIVVSNVLSEPAFKGKIYPVNPTRTTVLGAQCFPSIEKCPTVPELVVIVTPAKTVPALVKTCVDLSVPAVIIISSGFKEVGAAGQALEDEMAKELRRPGCRTRVVGPNCFGVMCAWSSLNATFSTQLCMPGRSAMISQSGAMVACILDWAMKQGRGFSSFVSVGSMMDVAWGDLLEYYARDESVRVIMVYMETIGDARAFLNAARHVSLTKPIVVLKVGRSQAAAKAAVSHTGSLAGSDDVVDAAFRRAGVIRVDTIQELFQVSDIVSQAPIPRGPRVAILTHAGGPGVVASDAVAMSGAVLADIPKAVIERLDPQMPHHWSLSNPLDLTGGATPDMYQKCLDELGALPDVDGILVFVGPLAICPPTSVASTLKAFAQRNPEKTVVGCFMGGDDCEGARSLLRRSGVPVFTFSDDAARGIGRLWTYRDHLSKLYAAPAPPVPGAGPADPAKAVAAVEVLIDGVRQTGRTIMTEAESKEVLRLYGIPVSETLEARTADEAAAAARKIGFPVVVKLLSETITHKSDVGGVILNVASEQHVRDAFGQIRAAIEKLHPADWAKHFLGVTVQPMLDTARGYEVLLGGNSDVQFGPTIVFGTGGKLVEVFRDRALALPPLTRTLARKLVEETKICKALLGTRGQGPVDMALLESILVAFGDLLVYHPLIKEVDINPLFCSESRICAIDARVVVWPKDCDTSTIPSPAIVPFPFHMTRRVADPAMTVRPLRPDDHAAWTAWRKRMLPDAQAPAPDDARIADLHMEFDRQLMFGALVGSELVAAVRATLCPVQGHAALEPLTPKSADPKVVASLLATVKQIITDIGLKIIESTCKH